MKGTICLVHAHSGGLSPSAIEWSLKKRLSYPFLPNTWGEETVPFHLYGVIEEWPVTAHAWPLTLMGLLAVHTSPPCDSTASAEKLSRHGEH